MLAKIKLLFKRVQILAQQLQNANRKVQSTFTKNKIAPIYI